MVKGRVNDDSAGVQKLADDEKKICGKFE